MNIVVIGPVGGCGKTAIARAMAEDFSLTYCSIDPLDQGSEPFSVGANGCVVDCPPEVTPQMETALQCADRVILVLKLPHLISPGTINGVAKLASEQTAMCRPDTPVIVLRMGGQQAFLQPSSNERDFYMARMYRDVPNVYLVKPYGAISGSRATPETAKAVYDLCKQ